MAAGGFVGLLAKPFLQYNALLEKHPLLVKSLTSGFMYALGDGICQAGEHYVANKQVVEEKDKKKFQLNFKRLGVFFTFG